jgi:hypothetical protein
MTSDPMKTTPRSLNFFRRYSVATLAIALMWLLVVRPVQASYIVTLEQVGSNVVATGSGTIDSSQWNVLISSFSAPGAHIDPMDVSGTIISTGPTTTGDATLYETLAQLTKPKPPFFGFGSGGTTNASSGSGDRVGIQGDFNIFLPKGYVSGTALSDTATYDNATFASLGINRGTYQWTWDIGTPHQDTFTLQVGPVPDTGSTFGLFFVSLIALFGVGRFRAQRLA